MDDKLVELGVRHVALSAIQCRHVLVERLQLRVVRHRQLNATSTTSTASDVKVPRDQIFGHGPGIKRLGSVSKQ